MPHVRLGLPLRPMREYRALLVCMLGMSALCLMPIIVLAFIDPHQALEQLKKVGIAEGVYLAFIVPTLVVSLRRDPLITASPELPPPPQPQQPRTAGAHSRHGRAPARPHLNVVD